MFLVLPLPPSPMVRASKLQSCAVVMREASVTRTIEHRQSRRGITEPSTSMASGLRPDHSLIFFRHRREAPVRELLHALAAIRLGCVDVALRIGGDAVHAVELARLPPAFAKAREELERVAQDYVDLLVLAVGEIQVLLLRIAGEGDVPRGSGSQRLLVVEPLFDEGAIGLEDLNPIVDAVADVQQPID